MTLDHFLIASTQKKKCKTFCLKLPKVQVHCPFAARPASNYKTQCFDIFRCV